MRVPKIEFKVDFFRPEKSNFEAKESIKVDKKDITVA